MLEPQITPYIHFCQAYDVPLSLESVSLQRERYNAMRAALAESISPNLNIQDSLIPSSAGHSIPIRIYQPNTTTQQAPQACCLFMHGGGFVVGNLETHHDWVAELCELSGVMICSIDYRLSPEHRYPAALNDVSEVFQHLISHANSYHIDPQRIALCGDSAGGNLAAAMSLLARDKLKHLPQPKAQLLIYPS
ncbi:MAG: alpha/beta hydrolase [Deinococcales bacterium]